MNRWALLFILLIAVGPVSRATGDVNTLPPSPEQENDQNMGGNEGEEKGIIPHSAELVQSTQPVTPVSTFPEKPIYDIAREELAHAEALWAKGESEAASDTALEAFDDLVEIHRHRKKEKKKLYAERHRAATIYVEGGIRFIQDFVDERGNTPNAIEEGRSRFEDLRDVARDYEELTHDLNKAIETISSHTKPSENLKSWTSVPSSTTSLKIPTPR